MASYSQTTIVGNVGRDAEMRYTPQGKAVLNWSVAVTKRVGRDEQTREMTTWFKCAAWGEKAEYLSQHIHKGAKLMCVGEVSFEVYVNKERHAAGNLVLTVQQVVFLDKKPADDASAGSQDYDPNTVADDDPALPENRNGKKQPA